MAPSKFREMDVSGSANRFSELRKAIIPGKSYIDAGDLNCQNELPEAAYLKIKETIMTHLREGARLISLGGDHSISYPIIEAHAVRYPKINVLQIDAHADLYQDFEGNPYSHASPFARLLEKGLISSLTQVGIRSMTDHLYEQAEKYGVRCIEMKDFGMGFLKELEGPLYLSLDMDAFDPAFAPGVSHHEPGGLTSRQVIDIIHNIEVEIVGADIVELNPERDLNDVTAMLAYKLFKEICTKMMQG